jgi:hypothetical protein
MKTARYPPGQALAERIAARLVEDKLLTEERAERFSAALASGKLKAGDWRLAIEAVKQADTKPNAQ